MAGAVITLASITEAATKSVLTVGSGDGSQQAAVARAGHKRLTCTFMDSEEEVCSLYVSARAHIEYLKGQGVPLLFSVDAMQLGTGNGPLGADCKTRFDLISWYFPHSGATPNDAPHAVESNRRLIRAFLAAAPRLLKRGGTIQVTVMRGPPYDHWRVPELLPEDADLALLDVRSADNSAFRGYTHRLTNTDGSVSEQRDAELFVFGRRDGDAAAATPQAGAALDAAGPRRAGERVRSWLRGRRPHQRTDGRRGGPAWPRGVCTQCVGALLWVAPWCVALRACLGNRRKRSSPSLRESP